MKKVLIVAYFWPYRQGSIRTLGLTKYLPEFRWQPIILTAPLHEKPDPQFRVIETSPYPEVLSFWKRLLGFDLNKNIRNQVKEQLGITSKRFLVDSFLTFCGEVFNYPDSDKNWIPLAVKAGKELLQNEHVDAIISVSPVTRHLVAKELKVKYKIPWIADFPDLWTQNHNYQYGSLRKLIDRRLELKTISKADVLVTVSQPWAEKLRTLHKGHPVYAITHGFDPAIVNTPPVNLTTKFTITYTGSIYLGKQAPSKLFAALQDLISEGAIDPNEVEIRFYGSKEGWLAREIEKYGLSVIAKQYGRVSRQIVLEKQRESQLLLLLDWEYKKEKGVCPGKIYEYLAARRPILAIGGSDDNVIRKLLDETKAGRYGLVTEDIKSILRELYSEYKLKGKITYNGDTAKINKYSYREMAKKFAEILNHLI